MSRPPISGSENAASSPMRSSKGMQSGASSLRQLSGIRAGFLDYFAKAGHLIRPSSPLVPDNDPTLLFTNAGMVQFKNAFTGLETPVARRVATSQKCVRAGGKHNDLDNVGYTARHHTFFEMLGNFSFGDYFKEEAIYYAWDLVNSVYGLPKSRLLVTVYADDEEAAGLWRKIAGFSDDRIIRIASSDNFWSMGDTGPCGPCSEIFFDHGDKVWGGPPGSAEQDGDRFIEIWNLVFMQFDQAQDGTRVPLPKPSIDTGMGLERISAVMQGVHNNYQTDLFEALITAESDTLKRKPDEDNLASFRVIADHLRATAFLIADGVLPSSEGRGYVLRRIMRRAMRHAHILGAREPVLHGLVDTLVSQMGAAFPELVRAVPVIVANIEGEEERFQRTLGRGLEHLETAVGQLPSAGVLDGETAFKLYDTFGFPLDLTQDVLRTRGMTVDTEAFEVAMERQKAVARGSWQGSGDAGTGEVWFAVAERAGHTDFVGYEQESVTTRIVAIAQDGRELTELTSGQTAEVVFERTPAYAESGGQAGDRGLIHAPGLSGVFSDTQKRAGGLHVHKVTLTEGTLQTEQLIDVDVDGGRRARLRANHSATHLLHAALRRILGPHIAQKGSLVEADRLRFDFSHMRPISAAELDAIAAEVNTVIRQNTPAKTDVTNPEAAIAAGAMALFGEKYGDEVRVLSMGRSLDEASKPYSVELCGGTHVARTGDIGAFVILSEGGVSAGVRRIEATTGADALAYLKEQAGFGQKAADLLRAPLADLPNRLETLLDQRRKLETQLSDALRRAALGQGANSGGNEVETLLGVPVLLRIAQGVAAKDLRTLIDEAKAGMKSGVIAFVAVSDGKAAIGVGVTPDLVGKVSAVDLVRVGAEAVGGKGGGGRPDLAQAGGPEGEKANEALAAIRAELTRRLT